MVRQWEFWYLEVFVRGQSEAIGDVRQERDKLWTHEGERMSESPFPWQLKPRESLDTKMADKHTISVIGLLKDVEFHIIKGAAEVILTFNV